MTPQVAAAIQQQLDGARPTSVADAVWKDVRAFYAQRANEPLWVRDGKAAKAAEALRAVRRAANHGFDPADYDEAGIARVVEASQDSKDSKDTKDTKDSIKDTLADDIPAVAQFDVRVTAALLALGRDVALGTTNPESIDARWKARRTAPDLVASLTTASAGGVEGWLDSVRPAHPEYAALQATLAELKRQQGSAEAADGRAQLIALNMERWRWMPDDLGARHVLVNIPAFYMAARENGQPALEMKVVVGKKDHQTPIFSGEMSTIVFSPYWNVPDNIAEGETAPAAARDANYLARNHIEILRVSKSGTTVVDPARVHWNDPEEIKELAFRQKPGADNALGYVKFLFPNKYDVYLHDTPADALFARAGRALSHGCIRLEQPDELARYVLRDSPEWDEARIQTAMHAGEEKHVALKEKIPVHIVYFTAWPDGAGGVNTWPDIYEYDARQVANASKAATQVSRLN